MIRVTEQSRITNHMRYLGTVAERLDQVQRELTSGRRIERASDDPAGATIALGHRKNIAFETQIRRNLDNGAAFMNTTEAALGNVTEALQRARELTIAASTSALSQAELKTIAREVDQIIEGIAQAANTDFGGAYIFSGHQTKTPAYALTGSPPTAVTFQGDTGQRIVRISKQDTTAINVPGSDVFGTLFDDLIQLRDNLDAGAGPSTISSSIAGIDLHFDSVIEARAEVGARINRFEAAFRRSEQTDTNLQDLRSEIEEIDIADTIVRLNAQQTAMEAALGAIGRTSNLSLMNFLR